MFRNLNKFGILETVYYFWLLIINVKNIVIMKLLRSYVLTPKY